MKWRIIVAVLFFMFVGVYSAYASGSIYYSAERDEYVYEPNGDFSYGYQTYSPSGDFVNDVVGDVDEMNNYTTWYLTCNGYYLMEYYNTAGEKIGQETFHTTEIVSPPDGCTPTDGTSSGGSTLEKTCPEAIADLQAVNEQILSVLQSNGAMLANIFDQLQPDGSVSVPAPPVHDTIEDHKPDMPTDPYVDNSTHFSDQGSADPPGPLPSAPEPDECWANVCQEDPMPPDPKRSKDEPLPQDPVKEKDPVPAKDPERSKEPPLTKDPVRQKDPHSKDPERSKSPPLSKDPVREKDPHSKDPERAKDPEKTRDNVYLRNNFYNQQSFDATPDWTSP